MAFQVDQRARRRVDLLTNSVGDVARKQPAIDGAPDIVDGQTDMSSAVLITQSPWPAVFFGRRMMVSAAARVRLTSCSTARTSASTSRCISASRRRIALVPPKVTAFQPSWPC